MLSKSVRLKGFKKKISSKKIKTIYKKLLNSKSEVLNSLSSNYHYSFNKKNLSKYKKNKYFRVIGMGGSTLGSQAIYDFLKHRIKKNFLFIDNLKLSQKNEKKNFTNLVISKSGNTIETIVNANILIKNKDKNIFITEDKHSYLKLLANKLKAEIIDHNNFIGGRYSVLSEVGMLPAELMGLDSNKFKQINSLIKNKQFENSLLSNVAASLYYLKKKKFNSIIINYDEKSDNLFKWYQQLVAESLGKSSKGVLPIISDMPKDNHSLMQYYLDGSNQVNYKQDVSGNSNISNELHIGEKLGVGNNIVPEYPLHVDGTTFSSTSWSTSDDRVKHNEQSIDGALDTIDKLEPKHYIKTQKMYDASHNFTLNSSGNPVKDNGELLTDYTRETGLIAQEVKDIPELAFAVKDGAPMSVDYNSIHCTHIAATKELNTKIEALKAKNTALEEENTQMEQDLQNIKQHLGI